MCGIFGCFEYCTDEARPQDFSSEYEDYKDCISNNGRRGPDDQISSPLVVNMNSKWTAAFQGWVLWTQGSRLTRQPLRDASTGNILLWNGDIFSGPLAQDSISDTRLLYTALQNSGDIVDTLTNVEGPYSFIYHHPSSETVYFGRDSIGRHSLLMKIVKDRRRLLISSVASKDLEGWVEVPAMGIFMVNLKRDVINFTLFPWREAPEAIDGLKERLGVDLTVEKSIFSSEIEEILAEPAPEDSPFLSLTSGSDDYREVMANLLRDPDISNRVDGVLKRLREAVRLRVEKKPNFCKDCLKARVMTINEKCEHPKIGLLFSGGLDSTILAAIAHEFVAVGESIELINVAFEKAKRKNKTANEKRRNVKMGQEEKKVDFEVPDRKTGRTAWEELRYICPGRQWNFVESNITQEELETYLRTRICHLVYPRRTVLDESLGCALWFAARASGTLAETNEIYESPCRILLLGMGADELFGGYTRHRVILKRKGWAGLANEFDTEINRISERNLGRDDRVVSDHGRQSRLPYLDDNFVKFVTSLKPWERCCPVEHLPPGLGDKLLLRLCAFKLGLKTTSGFPKRAFQFGSRIAKSYENASDISEFL